MDLAASSAFTVLSPATATATATVRAATRSHAALGHGATGAAGTAVAVAGLAAVSGAQKTRRARRSAPVMVGCSMEDQTYYRDHLVACRAQLNGVDAPTPEETDKHMEGIQAFAKQALAGASAAMLFTSSMEAAVAYPIFAQQNYANPREYTGKIVCANCHLASKPIEVRLPQAVLPDTIFKMEVEVPAKYAKRRQPLADGSKGPMNIGAIAVMPEGWKLAPKDRLPKPLKKEMKGLAWAPYSKEYPNIVVAGPVPGETYEKMVLPVLSPDPNTNDKVIFGKGIFYFGGNRGRGQVYPEGNQSNNNQFLASATGTISAIDGLKVSITTPSGEVKTQECLTGADIVVQVGDEVTKDEPLTTNPNVGGFGQEEKECILQDMNRVYAFCAFAFSCFIAQLSFVLKKWLGRKDAMGWSNKKGKRQDYALLFDVLFVPEAEPWKQFEKVQLAEASQPQKSDLSPSATAAMALAPAFTVVSSPGSVNTPTLRGAVQQPPADKVQGPAGAGVTLAAAGLVAAAAVTRRARRAKGSMPKGPVMVGASVAAEESYYRDHLVACRAQLNGVDAPTPEETDKHMEGIQAFAKQALAGASAAMLFTSSMEAAVAYPIFAQQNYANPREYTGKIVCANCHLASKPIEVRLPQAVLPDTIFKMEVEVPAKYAKRRQPLADGSKGPMNIGAIAVMPEGWKLAPKDRLPKPLKKEMKGLAWAPYSKEYPNIVVAGPVPGETYEKMVLPVLSPDPNTNDKVIFGKGIFYFGGNRGRGQVRKPGQVWQGQVEWQVYPEGNQSNNNQFLASATGTISAIDGLKVSITTPSGEVKTQECLTGADIVVQVGDEVTKDEPLTTNPNVGGFGQEEKECILQDMNRVYAFCAFAFSCFIAQLSFVLKKKQFEKVQLAEGF
ncbi:unnamed protein product [Cladocopium goreaui]|uniref:Cytochrome f n=1 Tax=Cladocopium goreaui TaxID=2562237 RepID=A0A9P1GIQ9_9DINO|nr:unnamed protein product [Cladocopium goreaui]